MLARINKAMAKKDSGFTLIELLVVVIIIGILAAIAIPTFLNQREAGFRAQTVSDLRNAATEAETYAVENNGGYVDFDEDELITTRVFNLSEGVDVGNVFGNATSFCIEFTHANLDDSFAFLKANGEPVEGTCASATATGTP